MNDSGQSPQSVAELPALFCCRSLWGSGLGTGILGPSIYQRLERTRSDSKQENRFLTGSKFRFTEALHKL